MNMNVDFFRAIEEFVGRWVIRILALVMFIVLFFASIFGGI